MDEPDTTSVSSGVHRAATFVQLACSVIVEDTAACLRVLLPKCPSVALASARVSLLISNDLVGSLYGQARGVKSIDGSGLPGSGALQGLR